MFFCDDVYERKKKKIAKKQKKREEISLSLLASFFTTRLSSL